METKVSVIVPVHNAEPYLRQCLDSLLAQTIPIEIIAVDNASTDGSADILRTYESAHANVRAFYNEVDKGQAYSMNRALDAAVSEYIGECDADDWAEPTMYDTLYTEAVSWDCDVARCNVIKHIGGTEKKYSNLPEGSKLYNQPVCIRDMDPEESMWALGRWCCIPAGIYKRTFLLGNSLRYREHGVFEDNSLSFKIRTTADKYMYIPDYLYHYRMDNPASGTHSQQNIEGIREQFDEIDRYAKTHGLTMWPQIGTLRYYIYMWAFNRLTDEGDRLRFLAECREDFNRDVYRPYLFNNERDIKKYEAIRWGKIDEGSETQKGQPQPPCVQKTQERPSTECQSR